MSHPRSALILTTACLVLLATALACSIPAQVPTLTPSPVTPTATPTPMEPSLVGTWITTHGVNTIAFVFEADGNYAMYMDAIEVARGQYATLESIDPPGLTLIAEDGQVVVTIYRFISPDEMEMANSNSGTERPTTFTDSLFFQRSTP